MNINLILIWNYFFATAIIFCRNSLYSIISLVFLIIGCCFILFSLGIEFLAFILLLIYIGAITILFLFVVMMLQLDKIEKSNKLNSTVWSKHYLIYLILILKLSYFFFYFNKQLCLSLSFFSFEFIKYNKDINDFCYFLFNDRTDNMIFLGLFDQKFLFFIITGFSLLFSMVGSIALCLIKNK